MAEGTNFIRAYNEELRSYDSSGGDSTFQEIGASFSHPIRMLKFKNNSNVDITISYDGTTDQDIILAGDREIEDLTSNKTINDGFVRHHGTQVFAKSSAGTGDLYLIAIYAD